MKEDQRHAIRWEACDCYLVPWHGPFAAQDVAGAVEGTVSKVDRGTKMIAVKTRDGSEEILHIAKRTAVHGSKDTDAAGSRPSINFTYPNYNPFV